MEALPVESDSLGNYRADGALVNVVTGMGTASKDKSVYTRVGNRTLLSQSELELLYLVGIPRRFVDAIPEEMFRHLPTIKIGGDEDPKAQDKITAFEENLKELKLHATIAEAITLQRLYGGACVIALVDDGLDPSEPLDIKRIRDIEGFVALSRHECIPEDVNILDYSKPRTYRVSTSQRLSEGQSSPTTDIVIHSSRVARFDGLYLPWNLRSCNTGWGMSCIQLVWDAYVRYESALSGLDNMIQDSDMFVHKMPGLFKRLAAGAGGEDAIRRRLEANVMARSNYGGMAIDGEEDISWLSRSLGNFSQAITPFVDALQADTGWPASILMGSSPGGLGKEGRFEERTWAALVERWQDVYCRGPVTELYTMLMHSRTSSFKGTPPEKWEVLFPSVFTQTDEEKAAIQEKFATVDSSYVNMGALDPLEIRKSRFGGSDYSMEITLDPNVSDMKEQSQTIQHETQMLGMQTQQEAMLMQALSPQPQQPGQKGQPPENASASGANAAPPENASVATSAAATPAGAPPAAPSAAPAQKAKRKDAIEHLDLDQLRIRVSHEVEGIKAGLPVDISGQRVDSLSPTYVVVGPQHTYRRKFYRAMFKSDSAIINGPLVTGFQTTSWAAQGIAKLYPGQSLAGLQEVPPAELESIKAVWESY